MASNHKTKLKVKRACYWRSQGLNEAEISHKLSEEGLKSSRTGGPLSVPRIRELLDNNNWESRAQVFTKIVEGF